MLYCNRTRLKQFSLTGGSEETPRLLSESVQSAETRCGVEALAISPNRFPNHRKTSPRVGKLQSFDESCKPIKLYNFGHQSPRQVIR